MCFTQHSRVALLEIIMWIMNSTSAWPLLLPRPSIKHTVKLFTLRKNIIFFFQISEMQVLISKVFLKVVNQNQRKPYLRVSDTIIVDHIRVFTTERREIRIWILYRAVYHKKKKRIESREELGYWADKSDKQEQRNDVYMSAKNYMQKEGWPWEYTGQTHRVRDYTIDSLPLCSLINDV